MAKIMIIGGLARSLLLFRGDLIKGWLAQGHEVTAAAPEGGIKKELEKWGVKYIKIPLKRTGLNPAGDLFLLGFLIQLLRKKRPDYLFLYTVKPVIYGSLAATFLPTCRVYSMITGLGYVFTSPEGGTFKKLVTAMYRAALKRNRKVFFQNPDDAREFVNIKVIEEKKVVLVNGSGVNVDHFYRTRLPEGPVTFLLISRLLKEKGIIEYVEAARMVKEKYPAAGFRIIGWPLIGDPSTIKPKQLERWKEEGIVEILGETDDVRPIIAEASVYVLPSYREGTPRTVLEAMAMGRPVITTDVPGCRETVTGGLNGFLVPVKDAKALAAAMEKFLENPEQIGQMGRESRKLAEEKYDVHKINRVINETMGIV